MLQLLLHHGITAAADLGLTFPACLHEGIPAIDFYGHFLYKCSYFLYFLSPKTSIFHQIIVTSASLSFGSVSKYIFIFSLLISFFRKRVYVSLSFFE